MSLARAHDASYKFAFGVDHFCRCQRWSGGIEARTGLRMMPTFPRSSLSSRESRTPLIDLRIVVIVARPQRENPGGPIGQTGRPPILISRAANSEHGTSQRI